MIPVSAEPEQRVLHTAEAALDDEGRNGERGQGNAHVARHAEDLEARGDTGELGARRADVGHEERPDRERGQPHAVALTDEPGQALPRDDAHADAEVVEDHESDRRHQEDPEHPVPELRTENRVGRDARRVVVGETGK